MHTEQELEKAIQLASDTAKKKAFVDIYSRIDNAMNQQTRAIMIWIWLEYQNTIS